MSPAKASSPAHFRTTLSGGPFEVEGTWAQQSGGNKTAEARRYREGGSPSEEVAGGPSTRDDMTLSRPFKRDRDLDLALKLDRAVGSARFTVTKQPLGDDFEAYGKPIVFADALLIGCNWPDGDADGGDDTARIEITVAVSGDIA